MTTTLEGPHTELEGPHTGATAPDQLSMDIPLTEKETDQFARCEAAIQEGMETFWKVGTALSNIRDRRLYRQTHTFEQQYHHR